jgi:ABC-type glycerol-3-phosphate transport system substrate-binding protein
MMVRTALLVTAAALALTACGRRADLAYPEGSTGPATPTGAAAPPTPRQLTEPTVEARPERDDEVLRQSEEREPDPFDLPPE